MATIIKKDENSIEELLGRGVAKIYPSSEELKKRLLKDERLRLYGGFDPSAPSMHIGNAILINKLAQFQALGHEVIFLIGDFTGMIGDPTDKAATRKKLTREEVRKNSESYQIQASAYLDFDGENKARVVYNSEWCDKLSFKDLIELTSNFTVQQMLQRDMFQKRIAEEKPIHLHEFLYPLTQGYDSVVLDVDLEIGGNDQMFNMMAGRHLMQALGKKDKFVMTLELLADENGKKMGKSEGNAVFLDQEANSIYGAVMSWTDGVILPAFELATKVPMAEVAEIRKQLASGANPRDYKMRLAFEIVKLVHGEKMANEAQDFFVRTIQNKEVPDEITNYELRITNYKLVDLLLEIKMVASKGEGRRLVQQHGIKVDGEIAVNPEMEIVLDEKGILLQRGKRQFVRAVLKK